MYAVLYVPWGKLYNIYIYIFIYHTYILYIIYIFIHIQRVEQIVFVSLSCKQLNTEWYQKQIKCAVIATLSKFAYHVIALCQKSSIKLSLFQFLHKAENFPNYGKGPPTDLGDEAVPVERPQRRVDLLLGQVTAGTKHNETVAAFLLQRKKEPTWAFPNCCRGGVGGEWNSTFLWRCS